MIKRKRIVRRFTALAAAALLFCGTFLPLSVRAASLGASLSCFVNAMGGVEFGEKLLTGASVKETSDGKQEITLNFTDDASLVIYTVNAHVFVNPDKSPVGFYDAAGKLRTVATGDVTIKKSGKTAQDPDGNAVHYLESMTFTVDAVPSRLYLYLYIDSQVMGVQFCDGSGAAASNHPNEETPYQAVLTFRESSSPAGDQMASSGATGGESAGAAKTEEKTAKVIYDNTVTGEYTVSIPAEINVDKETKTAAYVVAAQKFDLREGAYVTVGADAGGQLKNGDATIAFTNVLQSGRLTKTGDKLNGTITVTGANAKEGRYEGTVRFLINYFDGE